MSQTPQTEKKSCMILYDIDPIKMVEQRGNSRTSTTSSYDTTDSGDVKSGNFSRELEPLEDLEISAAVLDDGRKIGYAKKYLGTNAEMWDKIKEAETRRTISPQNRLPNTISHESDDLSIRSEHKKRTAARYFRAAVFDL